MPDYPTPIKIGNFYPPQKYNKNLNIFELWEGDAQSVVADYFTGSADIAKVFDEEMNGISIFNNGSATMTFTIDGVTRPVPAGGSYQATFKTPFTEMSVSATGVFHIDVMQQIGAAAIVAPSPVDTTAPDNVTNLSESNVTQSSLTLTWTASTSSDIASYEVWRSGTLLATVTATNYDASGMAAATQYTFTIKAKDATGNISSGTSRVVSTSAQPSDSTPPNNVTNLATSAVTQTGLTLTYTASDSSDIKDYRIYQGSTLIATITGVTHNVTGLTASTGYTFTVKARDTSNNEAPGVSIDATTSAPVDTTAPTVTASPNGGTFTSAQSVELSSNESGTTIYYTTNGATPTEASTVYSSAISVNASGSIKFFGKDAAGNSSAVQTVSFTINIPDTTAPDPVTSLAAGTPTASTIPLTWVLSSSGDVATQEAAYSTDGTNFTVASAAINASSTAYTITGLTANTAYTLRVVAVDGAGNRSTAVTTTATTAAAAGPTVVVNDDFDRTNSTTAIGTATSGQTWSALTGTWGINGNQAYTASGTIDGLAVVESGVSDCTIETTIATKGTNPRIAFRVVDAANHFVVQAASSNYQLFQKVGGTWTQLTTGGSTPVNGDIVKIVLNGNSITVLVNSTQIIAPTTNTNHTTATKHGIGGNSTSSRFDNFKVTT